MFMACFFTLIGFLLLVGGAECLVLGSVAAASRLKIPTLIVGLTVVALGTTLPEFMVSVKSTMNGNAGMALGNIICSNIANILLVLAVSALINPIKCKPKVFYRDFSFLAVTTLFFAFFSTRGILPRWNGWVLLLFLFWFIFYNLYNAHHDSHKGDKIPKQFVGKNWWVILLALIVGVVAVAFGTDFLLQGAVAIAKGVGVSEEIIGVTILAVATSIPELATSCVAAYRKQNDIALGNVIGANIWNIVFIVGTIVSMGTVDVSAQFVVFDIWVMLFASFMLLPIMMFKNKIIRWEALFMLGCYMAYLYGLYLISIGEWFMM